MADGGTVGGDYVENVGLFFSESPSLIAAEAVLTGAPGIDRHLPPPSGPTIVPSGSLWHFIGVVPAFLIRAYGAWEQTI